MSRALREDGEVKPRRCPECGRFPVQYYEPWTGGVYFSTDDQGRPSKDGDVVPGTPRGGVQATCACGKRWWLRGVLQITVLEPQPSAEPDAPSTPPDGGPITGGTP